MLSHLPIISSLSAVHETEVGAGPGSGTLSPLFDIRRLSDVLVLAGLKGAVRLWVRGGTVSHCLAGVGADFGMGLCCNFG